MSAGKGTDEKKAWRGTTFGNAFMLQWLIRVLRHTDVRIWYVVVAIFVIPFCVLCFPSGKVVYHYFRRRQRFSVMKSMWMTYWDHILLSQVVIDKFAMYGGKHFHVDVVGMDIFSRHRDSKEPFVIFSSHIGCYELAGYTLNSGDKPFNALVYSGEKGHRDGEPRPDVHRNHIRMIPVLKDMSHLFRIEEALDNGEIVSLPADRIFGSPRSVTVVLLGSPAQLPAGPFSVAAMHGVDCLTVNVMKTSCRGYTAYVHELSYDKGAPRKEQVKELAQGYAAELERTIRRFPAQWYNYYEFWDD